MSEVATALRPRVVLARWKMALPGGRIQRIEGAVLHFVYGAHQFRDGAPDAGEGAFRDGPGEAAAAERLDALGLERRSGTVVRTFSDDPVGRWIDFLLETADALRSDGWVVECGPGWSLVWEEPDRWHGAWKPHAKGGFELSLEFRIGTVRHDMLALARGMFASGQSDAMFARLDQNRPIAARIDDEVVLLPAARMRTLLPALALVVDRHRPRNRVSPLLASCLHDLGMGDEEWEGLDAFGPIRATLTESVPQSPVTPPDTLRATLRPYQLEGLAWLQKLRRGGFGGILADDMGLGKTIQTLGHLAIEHGEGSGRPPSLVVCPTSLLSNWQAEARRFVPTLRTVVLHGSDRANRRGEAETADLVITSYPLLPRDESWLVERSWHVIVMDEAQALKNSRALARSTLSRMKAAQRIALTGTPMENHLGEVWSLADLLLPGLLGSEARFSSQVRQPVERTGSLALQRRISETLAPFLLRRTKEQVARDLPGKTEIVQTVELEDSQRELYESVRSAEGRTLGEIIDRQGWEHSALAVLEALLRVRQVCCDPRLLPPPLRREGIGSAKMDWIRDVLPEMVEEGRRILVFSQFTSFLDLVASELDTLGIPFLRLDGSTRDRGELVERFQGGRIPVFLLSLKAGGTGLNLTRADTVLFLDPWWNPAAERQAADRAHRIGQTQPVFVYRLVARGTIEERILELQERKKRLADSLFEQAEKTAFHLTRGELEDLLGPIG